MLALLIIAITLCALCICLNVAGAVASDDPDVTIIAAINTTIIAFGIVVCGIAIGKI